LYECPILTADLDHSICAVCLEQAHIAMDAGKHPGVHPALQGIMDKSHPAWMRHDQHHCPFRELQISHDLSIQREESSNSSGRFTWMMEMIDILVRNPGIQTGGEQHHNYRRMMNRTSTHPRLIQQVRNSRSIEWDRENAAQIEAHGEVVKNAGHYADYVPPNLTLTDEMREAMPPRGGKGQGFVPFKKYPPEVTAVGAQKGKGGKQGKPAQDQSGTKSGPAGRGQHSAATQVPPPGDTNSTVGDWDANKAATGAPPAEDAPAMDTDAKSESTTQAAPASTTQPAPKEADPSQVSPSESLTQTEVGAVPSQAQATQDPPNAAPAPPAPAAVQWWKDYNTGVWYSAAPVGDHTQGDWFDNATGTWWTPSMAVQKGAGKSGKARVSKLNPNAMPFVPNPWSQGKGGKQGTGKVPITSTDREVVLNVHAKTFRPLPQSRDPRKGGGGKSYTYKGGKSSASGAKGKTASKKRKRQPTQGKL